jgi:rare lipoprotein A (peptidoglycan hydrolase)
MFHIKRISFWAALPLCFALVTPALALDDPPPGKKQSAKAATFTKPAHSKPTPAKASAKQTTSRKKQAAPVKAPHRKPKPKVKDAGDVSAERANRDIWLMRAKSSDILTGIASWYGEKSHGGDTASGINYDMYTFTAAHRTLPIGTVVKVTEHLNGSSVLVCITDRGPYVRGRIIDLSYAAAKKINLNNRGIGKVDVEVVGDENGAPLIADKAWYVRYNTDTLKNRENVGPFRVFADAAAMHEALLQAHPEAEVIMESVDEN